MRLIVILAALVGCAEMPELHFNEPPGPPTIHLEPAVATTDDMITLVIDEDSVDPEGDAVSYDYAWYKDGQLWAGTAPLLDPATTTRGEVWDLVVTPSDGEWEGEPAVARAQVVNTAPVSTAVTLYPEAPRTADPLVLSLDATDIDGDTVSWLVDWTVDGASRPELANLLTIDAEDTTSDQTWTAVVRPTDGSDAGESTTLTTYIDNTPPSVGEVTFTPSSPRARDTVTAWARDTEDDDGHQVTVDFTWFLDGVQVFSDLDTNGSSTLEGVFEKGLDVQVVAVPNDGFVDGDAVTSETVQIVNTPPTLDDVTLSPSVGDESTTFTCTPSGADDDDGDEVAYAYAWYVNGDYESSAGDTLLASHFAKDDTVSCVVTPSDGEEDGTPVTSNTAEVENTPPVIGSVSLSPTSPIEGNTVSSTISGATDADGDTITYTYAWTVSGAAVGVTTTSITSSSFSRGDTILLTVTPYDGDEYGTPVRSATLTVADAPASISSASVSPGSPTTANDLSVVPSGWYDADGDAAGYTYQWYRNGSAVSGATSSTLDDAYTTRGDRLYCAVTPDDGYVAGTAVNSNTVSVVNTAPTASAEVLDDTSALEECDEIQLDASAGADADGDALTYTWSLASKPSVSRRTSADIDATTDVAPMFLLDAAGTFTFQVAANDGYTSGSDTVSVTVSERADNTEPVADAGEGSTSSGFATCNYDGRSYVCGSCSGDSFTLDASASVDDDGDPLTYVWTTSSSYTTVASSSSELTTVTVANTPARYGETLTYDVSVRLRVIDCAGGAGEDYVTFSFDCTGI